MDAAANNVLAFVTRVRNNAILDISSSIIRDTPVLTGALKGSWHFTKHGPNTDPTLRLDGTGLLPMSEVRDVTSKLEGDQEAFLANGLRYSEGVEFDHWSTSRPEGMVRKNLVRWPDTVASLTTGTGR